MKKSRRCQIERIFRDRAMGLELWRSKGSHEDNTSYLPIVPYFPVRILNSPPHLIAACLSGSAIQRHSQNARPPRRNRHNFGERTTTGEQNLLANPCRVSGEAAPLLDKIKLNELIEVTCGQVNFGWPTLLG